MRGFKEIRQQTTLIEGVNNYNLQIIALPETHIHDDSLHTFQTTSKSGEKVEYSFFNAGKSGDKRRSHGIGLIIDQSLKPEFKKISDRICMATDKLTQHRLTVFAVYAPTLEVSEKNPEVRQEFYDQLDAAVSKIAKRNPVAVLGDLNAKVGSGWRDYPKNVGKFGKGELNNNGIAFLELCLKHDLYVTNTTFRHPLAHVTTWTSPFRKFTSSVDENGNKKPLLALMDYNVAIPSETRSTSLQSEIPIDGL